MCERLGAGVPDSGKQGRARGTPRANLLRATSTRWLKDEAPARAARPRAPARALPSRPARPFPPAPPCRAAGPATLSFKCRPPPLLRRRGAAVGAVDAGIAAELAEIE